MTKITTEQFISSFYGLNGYTIGERRKNLFHLLNSTQRNDYSDINFSALQPKTHLEAVFKLEVLLYFHKINDLIEVLKSENPILIDKVLKAKSWFWNEAFKNATGQQFVDDILGRISYNTKVQLLNKLAIYLENPKKGDEYYENVKSKYGLYLAAKLLPCCSKEFILTSVEKDNIKLMESKLLLIIKKHSSIIEDIFFALRSIGVAVSVEYDNVWKYIAHNNILLFLKLRQTYKTSFRLGWRCTQKFVNANKEAVVNNATDYYCCFHSRQMVRSLNDNFIQFYANLFPKSLSEFRRHDFNSLLQCIKYLRYPDVSIIFKTFEQLYGTPLWDNTDYISLELLEMLPVAERERKLQRNYKPDYVSDDKWMCYYPTKVSIPYLKERISLSSEVSSRAELVGLLVETCKINKDKVALAQICQFMVNRHRNDKFSVRLSFLQNIHNLFQLEDLDESHWIPINDLIKIFTLNDEQFYNASDFLENYILYRLKQNLPVKELLIDLCKLKTKNWNLFTKYPEFEKFCLAEFAKVIPQLYQDKDLVTQNVNYICALIAYNQRHKYDQISIFSHHNCIESVKAALKKERLAYNATSIISYCLMQKSHIKESTELLDYYLSVCESSKIDILIYLFRKYPKMVEKHLEKVTSLVLKQYTSSHFIIFWKYSKNYEHLEIPQNIIKICLNRIREDAGDTVRVYEKKLAVHALSTLMPSHEYLQLVALHYPQELKADAETQAGQKAYEFQEYVASSLKYLTPPSDALESILIFCKGDYLKLIQSSLYSVCCNTNEDKLQPFLAELMGRAVSIRKHALHLTFHILDKAEIFSILDKFMKSEKNASIRKFIFKHCFNFFVKNRDDYSWELVKLNIVAVDVSDQEALDILMQHNKIPKEYLDNYFAFTWGFLENLPDPTHKIKSNKASLLNSITEDIIPVLGKSFCEPILEKYFFKFARSENETRFQSAVQSFACKYITFGESTYVPTLFTVVKNYIDTEWGKRETEENGRICIQQFVEELCALFLGNDDAIRHKEVLTTFSDLWNEFLKPHEAFTEYLHLKFTVIYLQKLPVNDIVKQLATLCDNLVNTYGIAIMGHISGKINTFINNFTGSYDQEDTYGFIDNLVENHSSLPSLLLAIRLIDNNRVKDKNKDIYEKVIQILKDKNEPVIQIYLHSHFTKFNDYC